MGILGTEVYFDVSTHRENIQYLLRQFPRLPFVNNYVLYEMLDVFGDSIPKIPEFEDQINQFDFQSTVKGQLSKPVVLKSSVQETMFVESILGELHRRLDGKSEHKVLPFQLGLFAKALTTKKFMFDHH